MTVLLYFLSLLFLALFIWQIASPEEVLRRKLAIGLILCALAISGISLFWSTPGAAERPWPVNLKPGIDLKGGTQFTVQLEGEPSPAALGQAVEVIRRRVDERGVTEPLIQPAGSNRILVQIPGIRENDKTFYREQLERVAHLEFRMMNERNADILSGTEPLPIDSEILPLRDTDKSGQTTYRQIVVRKRAAMSGKYVNKAFRSVDAASLPVVIIQFNEEGKEIFGRLTSENVGKNLAIVLDGEVFSAPHINGAIYGNCEISGGNMSADEAEQLASVLENPLETPVKIVDERGVDPSLGKNSIDAGFKACLIGLAAVIIFMVAYYHLVGVFAVGALFVNLFLLLGLLSQFGATLTLPGIAGIVLTIGMSVDANVLIFERIREELKKGADLRMAIASGYDRAFSSILDANVTTIIPAAIMIWLGSGAVKGFGVVLTLGILSSLFSALIVTRCGLDWLLALRPQTKLTMASIFERPNFNFLAWRWPALAFTAFIMLASIGLWYQKGDQAYGVDFRGGDLLTLTFANKVPNDQIDTAMGSQNATAQYQKDLDNTHEVLSIRTSFGEGEKIEANLKNSFPEAGFDRASLEKVDAAIGKEFKEKSAIALLLGIAGIFFYVLWRFETGYALGAIAALIHDVVISFGVFIFFGYELSLPAVGAILTVAGYSINDTIVVFDRVRENIKGYQGGNLTALMNESLNATLSRTLLTSGTTLVAILALYIFGGRVIGDFALLLLVGVTAGTFSTLFIAAPIVLLWNTRKRPASAMATA
jgi:SecD/SecF fusion protein